MPLTNAQKFTLTQDDGLRNRVSVQIAKAANYVLAGGGSPPHILNFQIHTRARQAAANPGAEVDVFMFILAENTGDESNPANVTDSTIGSVVDANYAKIWAG